MKVIWGCRRELKERVEKIRLNERRVDKVHGASGFLNEFR